MILGDRITDLEQIEQSLTDLQRRLEQSFEVLDALTLIQTQFQDLAQTYQSLKHRIETVDVVQTQLQQLQTEVDHRYTHLEVAIATAQKTADQLDDLIRQRLQPLESAIASQQAAMDEVLQEKIQQRLGQLEKVIESVQQASQHQLANTCSELTVADQTLRTELVDLRREVTSLRQEWSEPQAMMQDFILEFEERVKAELKTAIHRLNQSGFNPVHLERLEKLDNQLQSVKTSLRSADQRSQVLGRWLVATMFTAAISLSFPVFLVVSGKMGLLFSGSTALNQSTSEALSATERLPIRPD